MYAPAVSVKSGVFGIKERVQSNRGFGLTLIFKRSLVSQQVLIVDEPQALRSVGETNTKQTYDKTGAEKPNPRIKPNTRRKEQRR